jgi:hypothetical protein
MTSNVTGMIKDMICKPSYLSSARIFAGEWCSKFDAQSYAPKPMHKSATTPRSYYHCTVHDWALSSFS